MVARVPYPIFVCRNRLCRRRFGLQASFGERDLAYLQSEAKGRRVNVSEALRDVVDCGAVCELDSRGLLWSPHEIYSHRACRRLVLQKFGARFGHALLALGDGRRPSGGDFWRRLRDD
jgi:hypothetical protein